MGLGAGGAGGLGGWVLWARWAGGLPEGTASCSAYRIRPKIFPPYGRQIPEGGGKCLFGNIGWGTL